MAMVTYVEFSGTPHVVDVAKGENVMRGAFQLLGNIGKPVGFECSVHTKPDDLLREPVAKRFTRDIALRMRLRPELPQSGFPAFQNVDMPCRD